MSHNIHASALGKLGKGRKKTMSKAAIDQRRNAAKRKRIRLCEKSIVKPENNTRHESVSVV